MRNCRYRRREWHLSIVPRSSRLRYYHSALFGASRASHRVFPATSTPIDNGSTRLHNQRVLYGRCHKVGKTSHTAYLPDDQTSAEVAQSPYLIPGPSTFPLSQCHPFQIRPPRDSAAAVTCPVPKDGLQAAIQWQNVTVGNLNWRVGHRLRVTIRGWNEGRCWADVAGTCR